MSEKLARPNLNNAMALAIGTVATAVGAIAWAVITATTEHEFSLVAIGIGALIGLSMFLARPTSYAIVGTLVAYPGGTQTPSTPS